MSIFHHESEPVEPELEEYEEGPYNIRTPELEEHFQSLQKLVIIQSGLNARNMVIQDIELGIKDQSKLSN